MYHLKPTLKTDLSLKRMRQVKPEVAFSLLKYFRWFVQSHKTTLVSFYIAQKNSVSRIQVGSVSQTMIRLVNKYLIRRHSRGSQEQTTYYSESVI